MSSFELRGNEIRNQAKALVVDFMASHPDCQPKQQGIKQAQIFKSCGFNWGDYPKTTSSNQQYWVGAILQELKAEGKIERVTESGPWRLL